MDSPLRPPNPEGPERPSDPTGLTATLTAHAQPAPAAAPTLAGPFQPGELVSSRFRIQRPLAEGGMGLVYLATDEKLNQPRALKVAKHGFAAQLSPEARSALAVTHPNVCRVFEIHTAHTPSGPVDFLSMEFIDGGTLAQHLRRHGPFPEPQARRLATQICAALTASHSQNLLHRDLKSNNVLLASEPGGSLRAVVTDFGLAQQPAASPTPGDDPYLTGVAGTPEYLAPERWQGKPASVATDIFALGIVLHELISGRRPAGKPRETRTPDPKLPARWRTVISRCLADDPARRFSSAAEVADALTGRAARRRAFFAASAALLLLAVVLYRFFSPVTPPARLAILPIEAPGAQPATAALVRGASYDLSSRLSRLNPRPPQLVVIPIEETTGLTPRDPAAAKQKIGASHILRASVTASGDRYLLRAAIVDTSTQVLLRETTAELASPVALSSTLAALVAAAFNLPRQSAPEQVAPAAYSTYSEAISLLRGTPAAPQKALAAFEKAIQLDPQSPLPSAGFIEACFAAWQRTQDASFLERGRAELARASTAHPDSFAVHLAAGKLNLVPGSQQRATQEFQRAIQLDPNSSEAWRGLARSYDGQENRRAEAATAYLKAIELQPDYFIPLAEFADFQRRMGNYAEAEKLWRQALVLAPQSSTQHSNLGGLYADMGRWDAAEHQLLRALQLEPRSRLALNNLAALYQYRRRDLEAVQLLERARTLGPESFILALNLGDSYRRLNNAPHASAAYSRGRLLAEKRLLDDPSDAPARAFVAYFALRLGDRPAAERELVQALHFGPNDRTVLRRAVLCFEAMNQRERSVAVLQNAPPDLLRELNRQPDLTALQSDPRFQALLPAQTP